MENTEALEIFKLRDPFRDPFHYVYRLSYGDTDGMGVMHHVAYGYVVERARIAYFDRTRFPYRTWIEKDIHIPVLDMRIQFHRATRYGQVLVTEVRPSVDGLRFCLDYKLWALPDSDETQEGAIPHLKSPHRDPDATARTVHVAYSGKGNVQRLRSVLHLLQEHA